ncbi:MAG TPA: hypothetical protein PLZ84_01520, partial [Clostridia bacterium]|nr:hypothetical protein [Clostridia bacterium]
ETREPVAFVVALPDYNQVIKKMKGKMLPLGFIMLLAYKNKINQVRVLQQFCVPEHRSKGAILVAYESIYRKALNKYIGGEASTIEEDNFKSWKPVVGIGGEIYRTYRYYKKVL